MVGANSVITESLPPGVIAAGAPAKVIKEIEFGGGGEAEGAGAEATALE